MDTCIDCANEFGRRMDQEIGFVGIHVRVRR